MTETQFWNGNPRKLRVYEDAHILRLKQRNYEAWVQGQYIMEAFGVVLSKAFGGHGAKYPKKPYDLYPDTSFEIAGRENEANREKAEALKYKIWGDKMLALFSNLSGGGNKDA